MYRGSYRGGRAATVDKSQLRGFGDNKIPAGNSSGSLGDGPTYSGGVLTVSGVAATGTISTTGAISATGRMTALHSRFTYQAHNVNAANYTINSVSAGGMLALTNTSGGPLTLAGGNLTVPLAGILLVVFHLASSAYAITFPDEAVTPGCKFRMGGAAYQLDPGRTMMIIADGSDVWNRIG